MTTEKAFITLDEVRATSTWTKKDDSTPRGCVTVSASEIKPGDKVVVNNHFVPVVDIDDEDDE